MEGVRIRAQVRSGRLVVDEPTDLPDGTEVELILPPSPELPPDEQARLDAAIEAGLDSLHAGRVRPVREYLASRSPPK